MSFAEILRAWESRSRARPPAVDMNAALDRYPPTPESLQRAGAPGRDPARGTGRGTGQRRGGEPQAELDLHGRSGAEAQSALERFLREARGRGLQKVLIIHGKGNHSTGNPVLPRIVRAALERCPFAAAFGPAERRLGGKGATWVVLRGLR